MNDKPVMIGDDLNRKRMQRALVGLRAARGAPADRLAVDMADVDVAIAALDAILDDPVLEAMVDLRPGEPFYIVRAREQLAPATLRWIVRERVSEEGVTLETTLIHELADKMERYRDVPITTLVPT